jgi:acetyl-CoA acetyltransferase
MAMIARRYMIETGATEQDLGAVVLAQRKTAQLNDRAILKKPLTMDDYLASRYVAEPFRVLDCTSEIDGACAVVVTSLDRARSLPNPPVTIKGGAWGTTPRSGLDMADLHLYPDYLKIADQVFADRLWRQSGLRPSDIDVAELYDCFSSKVLLALEALGFVGRGEAGDFVRSGETALTGSLPVNTHGGLLSEGYLHGMNSVAEAVLQLQGRGDARQVKDPATAVVTSGGFVEASALVLARDGA